MANRKKISGRPTYGTAAYEEYEYMDGLINLKQARAAIILLNEIAKDLSEEGFDNDKIKRFVLNYVDENLMR